MQDAWKKWLQFIPVKRFVLVWKFNGNKQIGQESSSVVGDEDGVCFEERFLGFFFFGSFEFDLLEDLSRFLV